MERNTEEELEESLWDKDDSYIEIELDPLAPTCLSKSEDENCGSNIKLNESDEEEYEVRISISSTIPLPRETTTASPSASSSSLISGTFRDSNDDQLQPRLKFPPLNRLFNFKLFWENRQSSSHNQMTMGQPAPTIPFNAYTDMDMLYTTSTRKEGSERTTNGGMMKMLVKFRAIKLRTLLAPLVKVKSREAWKDKKGHKSSRKCRTIAQCYEKSMVMNPCRSPSDEEWCVRSSKRSMVEIDLGALRGMFSGQKGSSKRQSCSTSCETSPIHQGLCLNSTGDNSIQAAIAYCKTSFGQSSEFSFSP